MINPQNPLGYFGMRKANFATCPQRAGVKLVYIQKSMIT